MELLKSEEINLLQKHMNHSKHTVEVCYKKPSQTAALKAHSNKKLSQMRKFSNKKEQQILKE